MKEVFEFLKKAQTYYLATIEDNCPKVRPFGTVDIFDNRLYIQTGKKKPVSKQIQINPNVELCAFLEGRWLRLSGTLVRDERREAKKHMLDNYPQLRSMYSEDDDNTEVLYFKDAVATIYSFSEEPKTIKF